MNALSTLLICGDISCHQGDHNYFNNTLELTDKGKTGIKIAIDG